MTLKLYDSFSTAIREGAKLRPQAVGSSEGQKSGSCAISAGVEAMTGIQRHSQIYSVSAEAYPYLTKRMGCPICHDNTIIKDLQSVLWCLNDTHHWTRERIADWLELEEEKIGFVTVYETEPVNEMTLETTTMERLDAVSESPLNLCFQER